MWRAHEQSKCNPLFLHDADRSRTSRPLYIRRKATSSFTRVALEPFNMFRWKFGIGIRAHRGSSEKKSAAAVDRCKVSDDTRSYTGGCLETCFVPEGRKR